MNTGGSRGDVEAWIIIGWIIVGLIGLPFILFFIYQCLRGKKSKEQKQITTIPIIQRFQ